MGGRTYLLHHHHGLTLNVIIASLLCKYYHYLFLLRLICYKKGEFHFKNLLEMVIIYYLNTLKKLIAYYYIDINEYMFFQ